MVDYTFTPSQALGRESIPGQEYLLLSASISSTQSYLIPGAIVEVCASVTSLVTGFPLSLA